MKTIYIAVFGCISVAQATKYHQIVRKAALSSVKSFQKNRALAVVSETCENEIVRIEEDTTLQQNYDSIMEAWDEDFEANSTDYCVSTNDGIRTNMDCTVDFTNFEEEYETQCTTIDGGNHFL